MNSIVLRSWPDHEYSPPSWLSRSSSQHINRTLPGLPIRGTHEFSSKPLDAVKQVQLNVIKLALGLHVVEQFFSHEVPQLGAWSGGVECELDSVHCRSAVLDHLDELPHGFVLELFDVVLIREHPTLNEHFHLGVWMSGVGVLELLVVLPIEQHIPCTSVVRWEPQDAVFARLSLLLPEPVAEFRGDAFEDDFLNDVRLWLVAGVDFDETVVDKGATYTCQCRS